MGTPLPEDVECRLPERRTGGGSAALESAIQAHRAALVAGARHAVFEHARARLEAQLRATEVRRRAIERRWVPRLQASVARMRDQLEELDLEESLRVRWAADQDPAREGSGP